TWIVTSRATSERHWAELEATCSAPPAHSAARKVRIAMTAASALPPAESTGTSGALRRREAGRRCGSAPGPPDPWVDPLTEPCDRAFLGGSPLEPAPPGRAEWLMAALLVDVQLAVAEDEPADVELVHQGEIVRRDHHRGPEAV